MLIVVGFNIYEKSSGLEILFVVVIGVLAMGREGRPAITVGWPSAMVAIEAQIASFLR